MNRIDATATGPLGHGQSQSTCAPAATITLPRLIGARVHADLLVDALPALGPKEAVSVDCRRLVTASPSFVDQLVRCLLATGAAEVRFIAAPTDVQAVVTDAAAACGGLGRVTFSPAFRDPGCDG